MPHSPDKIRNLAVVGAGAAGKTSLVDLFLFKAGATTRAGKVDDGSSLSDYTQEEKDVRHSLNTTLLSCEHQGCKLNLLDTPGYPDFVGEAQVALAAVDAVLIVVDASGNINAATRRLYQSAQAGGLPRFLLINKLDSDQAKPDETLQAAQEMLGSECISVFQPDGVGASFTAVNSLLDPSADEAARGALIESLVETDEEAMEKYLEEGEADASTVTSLYRNGVASGQVVPVLCCSVEKDAGVQEVLDHLVEFSPPAAIGRRGARKGAEDGDEIGVDVGHGETVAQVFKTVTDPYVGKLSFLRVWSGEVKGDTPLHLARTGKTEKLANLLRVQGKDTEGIPSISAGDLAAVAKVENLETSDTLYGASEVHLKPVESPAPMAALAMDPATRADEQKLANALRKLAAEDLTFRVLRDPTTKELVVSGITNLHLDTMIKRLKERFGVGVVTRTPRVALKETINATAEGHHRHKKQTGGAGQFGEVYLKVSANARGEGFEFSDDTVGGSIPKNFMPAVEKGVRESLEEGVFAGYPVVDVKVSIYDGKHHPVDSNETSFRTAGKRAFKDAFLKAKPSLLEPIVEIEIEVPVTSMGDITGDLNTRRGRINGMDTIGALQIIRANIPLREIQGYSTDLRSMTAGEGSYTYTLADYDIVPAGVAKDIRALYEKQREEASA